MKKTLLACSCVFLAAPAFAADLPARAPAPAPAPVYAAAPVFTWTGFYVGAQAGYAWGKDKWTVSLPAVDAFTVKPAGLLGGVHAGYNMQTGAWVLGVEGDLEYAANDDSINRTILATDFAFKSKIGARGSLRLRAGYAMDRALLYVTAGLAGADVTQTATYTGGVTKNSDVKFGWTAGVGLEYAISHNLSARAEYRYTDLGSSNWTGTILGTASAAKFRTTDHAVRVGLSYRFGRSASPVIARY